MYSKYAGNIDVKTALNKKFFYRTESENCFIFLITIYFFGFWCMPFSWFHTFFFCSIYHENLFIDQHSGKTENHWFVIAFRNMNDFLFFIFDNLFSPLPIPFSRRERHRAETLPWGAGYAAYVPEEENNNTLVKIYNRASSCRHRKHARAYLRNLDRGINIWANPWRLNAHKGS